MSYHWKIDHYSKDKKWAFMSAYIDARQARDVLDDVCGVGNWQSDYKDVKGNLYCGIGIKINNDEWVWKWDCGKETDISSEKGEASDALKRACVQWGIGRFLYELKSPMFSKEETDKLKFKPDQLHALCEQKLKGKYTPPPQEPEQPKESLLSQKGEQCEKLRQNAYTSYCNKYADKVDATHKFDQSKLDEAMRKILGKMPTTKAEVATALGQIKPEDIIIELPF